MKIMLNGKDAKVEGSFETVPDFVQAFYRCGLFPGEMITDIRVDHDEKPLDDPNQTKMDEMTLVEVDTITSEEVYASLMIDFLKMLDRIKQMAAEFAVKYRSDTGEDTHNQFTAYIGQIQVLLQMFKNICDFIMMMNIPQERTVMANLNVEAFQEIFQEIIASQEQHDWTLLADMMEYEFTPVLEEWIAFIVDNVCEEKENPI